MTVIIKDIVGKDGITINQGHAVYEVIHPALQREEDVTVDFAGIEATTAVFLNTAIGQLFRDITVDTVNTHLKFVSVSAGKRMALTTVMTNAAKYYNNDQYRNAVDRVIKKHAEEGGN